MLVADHCIVGPLPLVMRCGCLYCRALARNCNCPPNAKKGGDAGDKWRDGKPVRVVRNCKGAKHSEYAPEEGNRYDGIYKVS